MFFTTALLTLVFAVQLTSGALEEDKFQRWTVKINRYGLSVCSGTLLNNRFIVTLASCIDQRHLEEYQIIVGEDIVRAVSYILESPEGDDVIVGRLSSPVKLKQPNLARIPSVGNDKKVEKARQSNRPSVVSGIDVNDLKAGSMCSSTGDCDENMKCVKNRCVCTYCYEDVDGECKESDRKILVLGAGMSGISAAKTLEENGCRNFQILEGSDRIGGRVKAVEMDGYTMELGAKWIYGLGSNPMAALASEYGLSYTEDPYTWTVRDKIGNNVTDQADEEWVKLVQALDNLEKFAKQMRTFKGPDITAESLLRRFGWVSDNNVAEAVEVYGRDFESGKETASCSGKFLYHLNSFKEHGNDDWILVNDPRGYSVVIEEMSKTFLKPNDSRLLLNQTVTSIENWDERDGKVKVYTRDGMIYEADSVIVTFSLGVLQARQVSFVPSLSERKMLAIDKFGFGHYSIMYFKFSYAFWDDTYTILYATDRHGEQCTWYNMNIEYPGCNILSLTLSGFEAKAADRMEDEELIERGLDTLRSMYPGANITSPEAFVTSRWISDPLTMGSYSYWTPGFTPVDMDNLAMPEGKIFFAGEHISKTNHGFVHSALNSGINTALELAGGVMI